MGGADANSLDAAQPASASLGERALKGVPLSDATGEREKAAFRVARRLGL